MLDSLGTVLVVDDNPTNVMILTRSLQKAGYIALEAVDGESAIDIAAQQLPDAILLDMMLPGRDGISVCRELKGRTDTGCIPIIFVTAVTDSDQTLAAFAAGGCDYITKPFRSSEVLARVSVHVRLRQAEVELTQKHGQLEELASKLASANTELAKMSRLDGLTQLLNRSAWVELIDKEHKRFRRSDRLYSIIMMDVDHFKLFNDSQGHRAGDQCLRRVAKAIISTCRAVDLPARYGGEEFVVLAPETDSVAAFQLGERLRKAVWNLAIPHPASVVTPRVTISLGIATVRPGTWEETLDRADEALYVAKESGRNTACVYESEERAAGSKIGDRPDLPMESSPRRAVLEKRVIIVDDDAGIRAICIEALQREGFAVKEAEEGLEALTAVEEWPPDVIVLDLAMDGMGGMECIRHLKENPDTRDIPVMVISSQNTGEDVLAGLRAGADDYVTKPFRPAELAVRVSGLARLYQEHRDLMGSYRARGEQVRVLNRLVQYCRDISSTDDLNDVLIRTAEIASLVSSSRRVSVMLPDAKKEQLDVAVTLGIDDADIATASVPLGQGIAGHAFATGQPVVVNSVSQAGLLPDDYASPLFSVVPLIATPLGTKMGAVGVLNVSEHDQGRPFDAQEIEYVELVARIAATTIHTLIMRQAHDDACDSIMVALAKLSEHRDNDSARHVDRITHYALEIAKDLQKRRVFGDVIDDEFLVCLERAVPLHDIGKAAVPDHILFKAGELGVEEMQIMRTHTEIGGATIRSVIDRAPGARYLPMAADITQYHHEWFDGSGYPKGLRGEDIPLSARIVALADVYDALTTQRVYKSAVSHHRAAAVVIDLAGTQFDPRIVEAFQNREHQFEGFLNELKDEGPLVPAWASALQEQDNDAPIMPAKP